MEVGQTIQHNNKSWTVLEIDGDCIHLIDNTGYGICILITEIK